MRPANQNPAPTRHNTSDVLRPQVFSQVGVAQLHILAAFSTNDPQYFREVVEECIAHHVGGEA